MSPRWRLLRSLVWLAGVLALAFIAWAICLALMVATVPLVLILGDHGWKMLDAGWTLLDRMQPRTPDQDIARLKGLIARH